MFRPLNVPQSVIAVLVMAVLPNGVLSADMSRSEHDHAPTSTSKAAGSGGSMDMHMSMMRGMKEMQGMKMTGDLDYDFAVMMRHHHSQGIQMAERESREGKDEKMRELARKIIEGQKKEVAELDAWLKAHPKAGGSKGK